MASSSDSHDDNIFHSYFVCFSSPATPPRVFSSLDPWGRPHFFLTQNVSLMTAEDAPRVWKNAMPSPGFPKGFGILHRYKKKREDRTLNSRVSGNVTGLKMVSFLFGVCCRMARSSTETRVGAWRSRCPKMPTLVSAWWCRDVPVRSGWYGTGSGTPGTEEAVISQTFWPTFPIAAADCWERSRNRFIAARYGISRLQTCKALRPPTRATEVPLRRALKKNTINVFVPLSFFFTPQPSAELHSLKWPTSLTFSHMYRAHPFVQSGSIFCGSDSTVKLSLLRKKKKKKRHVGLFGAYWLSQGRLG